MVFLNDPSRIIIKHQTNFVFDRVIPKDKLGGGGDLGGGQRERIITYSFSSDTAYNEKHHNDIVDSILQDVEQWRPLHVKFVPFWKSPSRQADVYIHLSNDKTIKKKCGFEGLSCAVLGGNNIYLNETNWTRGSAKSGLSLGDYRKYVMTHEMCHILGYLHEECSGAGDKVSIMTQQTLGTGECKPHGGNLHFNSSNPPKISTKWD